MRFLPALLDRVVATGDLTLTAPDNARHRFGDGTGPEIAVRVTDAALDRRVLVNPELAVAEGYMDGAIEFDAGSMHDLVMLFYRNRAAYDAHPLQRLRLALARRLRTLVQHNGLGRARANAAHHYDLGNAFYRLWLDRDMQYSCGYWERGVETLDEAQTAKKRHIAAKLALEPGQRVLDIGCGWGGMALYLASVADVSVTGVTLSREQWEIACRRAETMGLSDRVQFELRDYREIEGPFDRIVSVGMLEHVGAPWLGTYYRRVNELLAPDGVALIHAISSIAPPGGTSAFLRKYIFPGGYAPSLSESFAAVERAGLWSLDAEIWRLHYAETLAAWRGRFMAVRDRAVEMYDERFARMWEIYLSGCEATFRHSTSHVFQMQLGRERDAVPITRDYIGPAKAALERREREKLPALLASAAEAFGETAPEAEPLPERRRA
jgi:cyclopropane-fatty-acyl-phospholipid synthase